MAPFPTQHISVRFPREEAERLRKMARSLGISVSTMVRALCRAEQPRRRRGTVSREAIHQLIRVGNNLNQIAHWANTHKHLRSERELSEALEQLSRAIKRIG